MNRPAPTSSMTASATSATTSTPRSRCVPAPGRRRPAAVLERGASDPAATTAAPGRCRRTRRSATAAAIAANSTRRSMPIDATRGKPAGQPGTHALHADVGEQRRRSPRRQRQHDSLDQQRRARDASGWRRARRGCPSRAPRTVARASIRFATFAQAISRTSADGAEQHQHPAADACRRGAPAA